MKNKIIKCEIVPATYDPKAFEIKVFYSKNDWHYFSRGFATLKEAQKVVKNLTSPMTLLQKKLSMLILLAITLHYAEPTIIEYPKQPAPVCIEYCESK